MTLRSKILSSLLLVLPFAMIVISLATGAYPIRLTELIRLLAEKITGNNAPVDQVASAVLFNVRLPRTLLACIVGASLSVSGAVLQSTFRNPLVSPYLLGISTGASFGACLIFVTFAYSSMLSAQISAFVFGLTSVLLAYTIGKAFRDKSGTILLLAGIVISGFFSALVAMMQLLADERDLHKIVFWLMGSFSAARWVDILYSVPVAMVGCTLLFLLGWRINVLALGDNEARTLGVHPGRLRFTLIIITSIMTASSVALSGPIGWIGLVIPNVVRLLVGFNNRHVVIGSISLGASFMLLVDILSRNLLATEIPIGILTALIGTPFFLVLVTKAQHTIWNK
jgi:iron complex transport system permease protein